MNSDATNAGITMDDIKDAMDKLYKAHSSPNVSASEMARHMQLLGDIFKDDFQPPEPWQIVQSMNVWKQPTVRVVLGV